MAGGSKPGERRGGRQKGTRNKRTLLAKTMADAFLKRGICPADVLALAVDGKVKSDIRLRAISIALPYLYAQKAAELRLGGVAGAPIEVGPIQIVIDYGDSDSGNIPDQAA